MFTHKIGILLFHLWQGISQGAAIVFILVCAVSTAAEETINPERNLPMEF